jgi:4-carboxymuconolactone decarboxylase
LGPVVGARSPGQSAYDGDVRLPSLAPEQWPGWLFEETAGWPRFAGRPELRQAGVYGTLANHPALFAALGPVMAHLLVDISLSEQQRELVIIRSCARDRGAYPYRQHVSIGRRLGLTDNTLTALANADAAMLEPSDQALVTLVDSLHRDGGLTDANWTQARAHFSVEQLFDATVTAGFYGVISFVLSSARTPLEPGTIELPRFASAR